MKTRLLIPFLLLALTGCDNPEHDNHEAGTHDHADGLEHDHSGDSEHVDRSQHLVHFTDQNELFLQYETLVAKRDSVFLAHITDLRDYTPIPAGFITITLSGGGLPDETFSGKRPVRAGIHIEVALPQYAGERQLSLRLNTPTMTTTHDLGTVTVYPNYAASKDIAPRNTPDNAIYLEKEAQWQADFVIQTPTIDGQQLMLPASAIFQSNEEKFIHVMQGAEFFERRAVTTGQAHRNHITITQGVTADEHVVIRGGNALLEDNEIATVETTADDDDTTHHH